MWHTDEMRDVVVLDPFRTPIILKQWEDSDPINSELYAAIHAHKQREKGIEASNRGGWHSAENLAEWPEPCVEELFRRARELSSIFVDEIMQIPSDTYRFAWKFHAWSVINKRGDYNIPHNHPSASWSGVYYVRADPAPPDKPYAGCIEFQDPRGGIAAAKPAAMYGHEWHRVLPRPGLMILFPSWMQHFVHPHDGDGERVVVSFDAMVTEESYDYETIRRARDEGRLGRMTVR